jgi:pimeloyl-ACP methyl ester carboxylesterase
MKQLLILHGALGCSDQFQNFVGLLPSHYAIYPINFSGHAGMQFRENFDIPGFAQEVIEFMNEKGIEKTNVFGYSMGGYVAMWLAKTYPDRIEKVITLATKFKWTREIAANEIRQLQPDVVQSKVPAFAETLRQRHAPNDWKELMVKSAEMLAVLGENNLLNLEDYKMIQIPSLICLGDRDKMITLEETVEVYKTLPYGQFAVLPGNPHPFEKSNIKILAALIDQFIDSD